MSRAWLKTALFLGLSYLLSFVYLPIYEHFIANLIKGITLTSSGLWMFSSLDGELIPQLSY